MAKKINGMLKTAAIIVGIFVTLGGIIWAFATQNSHLNGAVVDIAEQKEKCASVEYRVNTVEKAVIKIETQMEYVQDGQDDMMEMQRVILDEIRK